MNTNQITTRILYALAIIVLIIALFRTWGWCEEKAVPFKPPVCPKTQMWDQDKCLTCHVAPSFALKESDPHAIYTYPKSTKIIDGIGYVLLKDIDAQMIKDSLDYLCQRHHLKHVIIEIQSPGGSMFCAWRIKGLIQMWQSRGVIIETRVHGLAASAGFLIFVAGNLGHRYVSPTAELMWHELWSFKMFDISQPSDKEEEARILRHLQDTANNWIATRGKMTKKELDDKIRKKELWLNGIEARDAGFADKLIGME